MAEAPEGSLLGHISDGNWGGASAHLSYHASNAGAAVSAGAAATHASLKEVHETHIAPAAAQAGAHLDDYHAQAGEALGDYHQQNVAAANAWHEQNVSAPLARAADDATEWHQQTVLSSALFKVDPDVPKFGPFVVEAVRIAEIKRGAGGLSVEVYPKVRSTFVLSYPSYSTRRSDRSTATSTHRRAHHPATAQLPPPPLLLRGDHRTTRNAERSPPPRTARTQRLDPPPPATTTAHFVRRITALAVRRVEQLPHEPIDVHVVMSSSSFLSPFVGAWDRRARAVAGLARNAAGPDDGGRAQAGRLRRAAHRARARMAGRDRAAAARVHRDDVHDH